VRDFIFFTMVLMETKFSWMGNVASRYGLTSQKTLSLSENVLGGVHLRARLGFRAPLAPPWQTLQAYLT
jgi:hypothetical protein